MTNRGRHGRALLVTGAAIVGLTALAALVGPWLTPFDPSVQELPLRLAGPTLAHPFGLDELGRDILARVLAGARISFAVGLAVVSVSASVGTVLGAIAGYFGGVIDDLISRVIDILLAFPGLLLAIALVAVLGASMTNVILALAIVYMPRVARVVRASTLVVRELLFIEAARALGVSTWRILFIHILNNIASPILVQATFIFAYAVLAEAGLSFLGVGVPPELPTWGTMIASGQQFAHQAIWLVVFPGVAIILAALSLQMVGDGLRDLLAPILRKTL